MKVTADTKQVRIETESPGPYTDGPAHVIFDRAHAHELQEKLDGAKVTLHDTGEPRNYGSGTYHDARITATGGTRIGERTTEGATWAGSISGFVRDRKDGEDWTLVPWVVVHRLGCPCRKNLHGCGQVQVPLSEAKTLAKAIRLAAGWSLDDALAGDLDAIEDNFRQMIGTLHRVDTTGAGTEEQLAKLGGRFDAGFVKDATLDALADLILRPRLGVDREGRPPGNAGGARTRSSAPTGVIWLPIGQGVSATVSRSGPSFIAPPDAHRDEERYVERAMVTLMRKEDTNASLSLYMAPPALALREWAKRRTANAETKS